ncbi:DDB1- and CUL4-associated factor 11 [Lates japonicus]|uniref:DDB1- and CUL4-associated factor 11 n=1 Tax=Lates japonicus TaxID=270547 RepID=A0AAD3R4E4_LATJO|nr:DDB1- and CUL4-associated factor 11 [Lates japonicus]
MGVTPQPVGQLAGHRDGITFILQQGVEGSDPLGDARYLISNLKDQSIKPGMLCASPKEGTGSLPPGCHLTNWDYWPRQVPREA